MQGTCQVWGDFRPGVVCSFQNGCNIHSELVRVVCSAVFVCSDEEGESPSWSGDSRRRLCSSCLRVLRCRLRLPPTRGKRKRSAYLWRRQRSRRCKGRRSGGWGPKKLPRKRCQRCLRARSVSDAEQAASTRSQAEQRSRRVRLSGERSAVRSEAGETAKRREAPAERQRAPAPQANSAMAVLTGRES